MNDLITIIITTYKRSNLIENAIKSIINQTYKNIEIIVVDDNADNVDERRKTESIVKKYNNIIYIKNKKNLGGALARNEGIKRAKGKFIAFLDDDDEYTNDKIEKQYKLYKQHEKENIGLVFCNEKSVDYNQNLIYQQMLGCIAPTSFWLVPKKVFEEINYFEDSPSKQDSIVVLKILLQGYNVIKVPEKLVIFNSHNSESGISGTKLSNIRGILVYRDWCRNNYDRLDSKKQIDDVECNFSKQLISLYLINNMKKKAYIEYKNILIRKPFSKISYLSFLKLLFTKIYFKWLNGRNEL